LYDIADLSKVWVMFDAYESDLQFLHKGEKISFTLQALPGIDFSGNIIFIDPVIDPFTRVAKVRVETGNQSGKLKPEMFATGIVSTTLDEYKNNMIIPKTAILWTGKRSIVYVKQTDTDEPIFKIREIGLGPMLGESYVVTDGLADGEEIVTNGTFSVDAAAQLEGKPSMMNPRGGKTASMPGMIMPGDASPGDPKSSTDTSMAGMDMSVNKSEMTKKIEISMDFTMQLNNVYDRYIDLKNSLVRSNAADASRAAASVKAALENVDMKLLTGDAHTKWMGIRDGLDKQMETILSSSGIEEQRTAFSKSGDQLYSALQVFGLMDRTVYYQFCPMANDGHGAYWFSEIKDIKNPYYGDSMLTCGETRKTLKY
jgi:Cu(I)/Ag(I) efflux system membrane fusion protein